MGGVQRQRKRVKFLPVGADGKGIKNAPIKIIGANVIEK